MHAVVLGAGLAGLLAARVLSDFYERVTVVERDRLPDGPVQRDGVPQGWHGRSFPAGSARQLDDSLSGILGERPFVEFPAQRRLAAIEHVNFLDRHNVSEPTVITRDRVSGVLLVDRDTGVRTAMEADLVVDAMGRNARTPAFLEKLGYGRPAEHRSAGNRWRRYDRMQELPAGLLVIGDALCSLDPSDGQGMTLAALEALALQDYLRDGSENPQRFFCAAASRIGPAWATSQADEAHRRRSGFRSPRWCTADRPGGRRVG